MLEEVAILGRSIQSPKGSLIDYLNVAKLKRTKTILSIVIKDNEYVGVWPSENNPRDFEKYLYSSGSANGPDRTPASLITEPERTFNKKILKWFDRYKTDDNELSNIADTLHRNAEKIIADIQNEISNVDKDNKRNVLLTIKIKTPSSEKFLGEKESVRQLLVSQFEINKVENVDVILGNCSFCGNMSEIISNRLPISNIFTFSTFDKKGFLYGFNKSSMYKQIPVCRECFIALKKGKEWLDKHTYFDFEGYKYYVIPNFMTTTKDDDYCSQLQDFKQEAEEHASHQDKQTFLRYENNLLQHEYDLLKIIAEKGLNFNLIFVFISLKTGGKSIKIERCVQDVPSTWIKKIFDEYNSVMKKSIFDEDSMRRIISAKWEGRLRDKKIEMYLAALIRHFFPTTSLDMKFLDVISKLLTGSKISSEIFFKAFLHPIRLQIFDNWNRSKIEAIKSLALFLTMIRLNLITDMNGSFNSMSSDEVSSSTFEEILDSDAKKAVFLEGVLVGKLLAIQYATRKSTPFLDTLHGLHISFSKAKSLLPRVIWKLREYRASYTDIEKNVAKRFLLSDTFHKSLTDDESSYYFTLGMLLHSTEKTKE